MEAIRERRAAWDRLRERLAAMLQRPTGSIEQQLRTLNRGELDGLLAVFAAGGDLLAAWKQTFSARSDRQRLYREAEDKAAAEQRRAVEVLTAAIGDEDLAHVAAASAAPSMLSTCVDAQSASELIATLAPAAGEAQPAT